MGILKFPFPNPEDIYLHDTPDHAKFGWRTATSATAACGSKMPSGSAAGCSGSEPVSPGTDAEMRVQLPQGTPIYLTYITAQVKRRQADLSARHLRLGQAPPPQFASSY